MLNPKTGPAAAAPRTAAAGPPTSPDCREGKHRICDRRAWDFEHDIATNCECFCHEAAA